MSAQPNSTVYIAADDNAPTLVHQRDIHAVLDYAVLVEGLLMPGTLAMIFGPANVGKSFIALDLAAHVARGTPWLGRSVARGAVVYVALEGGVSLRNRVAVLKLPKILQDDTPLLLIENWRGFGDDEGAKKLIRVLRQVQDLSLVVIDTLSRAMAGYDENSGSDMMGVVGDLDRIREATGACVLVVHHSGKDPRQGARGHSSLRAAVDTEITVSKSNDSLLVIHTTKQRDMPIGPVGACRLRSVPLRCDGLKPQVFSCIVVSATEAPAPAAATQSSVAGRKCRMPESKNPVADIIDLLPQPSTTHWQKAALELGIKRQKFYDQLRDIRARGLVNRNGNVWHPTQFVSSN